MIAYKIHSVRLERAYWLLSNHNPVADLEALGAGRVEILSKYKVPELVGEYIETHLKVKQRMLGRLYNYMVNRSRSNNNLHTQLAVMMLPEPKKKGDLATLSIPFTIAQSVRRALNNTIIFKAGSILANSQPLAEAMKAIGAPDHQYVALSIVEEKSISLVNILNTFIEDDKQLSSIRQKIKKATSIPMFYIVICHSLLYGLTAYLLPAQLKGYASSLPDIWENLAPLAKNIVIMSQFVSNNLQIVTFMWYIIPLAGLLAAARHPNGLMFQIALLIPGAKQLITGLDWHRIMMLYAELCSTVGESSAAIQLSKVPETLAVKEQITDFGIKIKSGDNLHQAISVIEDEFAHLQMADAISNHNLSTGLQHAAVAMLTEVQERIAIVERKANFLTIFLVAIMLGFAMLIGFYTNFQISIDVTNIGLDQITR